MSHKSNWKFLGKVLLGLVLGTFGVSLWWWKKCQDRLRQEAIDGAIAAGEVPAPETALEAKGKSEAKENADEEIVPIHDWIYHTMFGLYSIYFRIGGWNIKGRENIPMDGPVIIAPNHASLLDPPLVGSSLPRLATTMGKSELFEKKHFGFKILGYIIQHMGTFPVKRGSADRRAIRRALQVLEDNGALVIFPEGTRTRDGELGKSELGIAMIAHRAKAPVVPAYIKGTEGCFSYLQPKARLIKAEIHYGKPIYFEEEYAKKGDRATLQQIADRIMEEIAHLKAADQQS